MLAMCKHSMVSMVARKQRWSGATQGMEAHAILLALAEFRKEVW
jgi:hypothetical protein